MMSDDFGEDWVNDIIPSPCCHTLVNGDLLEVICVSGDMQSLSKVAVEPWFLGTRCIGEGVQLIVSA